MNVPRCPKRCCRASMVERHDKTIGRIAWVCLPCRRNAAGQCRDCPSPLAAPKRLRCERCRIAWKLRRFRERSKLRRAQNHAAYLAKERARFHRNMKDPVKRARRLAQRQRAWAKQKAQPRTDLDRMIKREYARQQRKDPVWLARHNAHRRELYHANPTKRTANIEYLRQYRKGNREVLQLKQRLYRQRRAATRAAEARRAS